MSRSAPILLSVLLASGCAAAQSINTKDSAQAPTPAVSITRYTEQPLADYQAQVMNEATKLSFACRMFRGLYGRWPNDLAEIQGKTEGINFAIFMGEALVTPLPDDSARIEVFDGSNTRAVKAVPVELGITAEMREKALQPSYKIKL